MTDYGVLLEDMTDDELSAEWVAVMTATVEPGNREAQLAAIEAVASEVNSRYEKASFLALVITPKDALAVTEHLKRLIGGIDEEWFGPDQADES